MIKDVIEYITAQIKSLGITVVNLDQLEECKTTGVSLFLTGGNTFDCVGGLEVLRVQNMVIQLKGGRKAINTLESIEEIYEKLDNTANVTQGSTRIVLINCEPFNSISRKERTDYSIVVQVQYTKEA